MPGDEYFEANERPYRFSDFDERGIPQKLEVRRADGTWSDGTNHPAAERLNYLWEQRD